MARAPIEKTARGEKERLAGRIGRMEDARIMQRTGQPSEAGETKKTTTKEAWREETVARRREGREGREDERTTRARPSFGVNGRRDDGKRNALRGGKSRNDVE